MSKPKEAEPVTATPSKSSETLPLKLRLLLGFGQLLEESYPIRLGPDMTQRYSRYVFTKDAYDEVHEGSPLLGLDCEMCVTAAGKMELTSICVVDSESNVRRRQCIFRIIYQILLSFLGAVPQPGETSCSDPQLSDQVLRHHGRDTQGCEHKTGGCPS